MEFAIFDNNLSNNPSNIYSSLSGDNTTTFSQEEIALNGVYNDVWNYDDTNREQAKQSIGINLESSDKSKKNEHPSKEFILTGGLKKVLKEQIKEPIHKLEQWQPYQTQITLKDLQGIKSPIGQPLIQFNEA